jgi:hypothetical protein
VNRESLYKFKFNNAGIAPLEIGKGWFIWFLKELQRETFDVTIM